jgi:hypothetical protein
MGGKLFTRQVTKVKTQGHLSCGVHTQLIHNMHPMDAGGWWLLVHLKVHRLTHIKTLEICN